MTARKHFKQHVRARMERTAESYSTARRQILRQVEPNKLIPWHFPGNVPGATAIRSLLARNGKPHSEAMAFGIAGGIGIGVFTFCYEKEDFASFFIAGPGIAPGKNLGEIDMRAIAPTLARIMGVPLPTADLKPLDVLQGASPR